MTVVLTESQGPITIITLNRPERMNALGSEVSLQLREAIQRFAADETQFVAIIRGAGNKAFCAGGDLKEGLANAEAGVRVPGMGVTGDIGGVAACEKVTIAAFNGLAVAGGLELGLCCDIRIAAESAWFGLSEVKRGLLPGLGANLLARLMPVGAAMDLLLTGDALSAQDAFRLGLVQAVVPDEDLMTFAMNKATTIAQNSQPAVRGAKQVLNFWRNSLLSEQRAYYESVQQRVLLSGDVFEGLRAFNEKRPAEFRNHFPTPFDVVPPSAG
jgi:enoyl-CoA hydratase/carnithine racemase